MVGKTADGAGDNAGDMASSAGDAQMSGAGDDGGGGTTDSGDSGAGTATAGTDTTPVAGETTAEAGEGGDSDNSTAGTATAGSSTGDDTGMDSGSGWPSGSSYYPVVEGAVWVYRHEGGTNLWDETVTVEMDGDSPLFVDSPSTSGESSRDTLGLVGTSVMRVSKIALTAGKTTATVEYNPGFTRFDSAWLSQEVGYTEVLNYARQEWDATGQLVRDGERSHSFSVEAKGVEVEVPAGKFSDCLVIYRMRQRDATATVDDGDDKRYWFCAGVGKVKEEEPTTGKLETLVSCTVPGGSCP